MWRLIKVRILLLAQTQNNMTSVSTINVPFSHSELENFLRQQYHEDLLKRLSKYFGAKIDTLDHDIFKVSFCELSTKGAGDASQQAKYFRIVLSYRNTPEESAFEIHRVVDED